MLTINLLPWRQLQQQKQVRFFRKLLLNTLLVNILFFSAWHGLLVYQSHYQFQYSQALQKQNSQLQQQLKQIPKIIGNKNASANKECLLFFWQNLPKFLPGAIYLEDLNQISHSIVMRGKAENFNAIANLLDNLYKQPCFSNPRLNTINQVATSELNFSINFLLRDGNVKK